QVLGQAGQVGGMGTDMLSQMLNIGGQQRGIAGEQMGEEAGKWQFQQPWANPYINVINALQGGAPLTDYSVTQQGPGLGAMMLPALGGMLGAQGGASALGGLGAGMLGTTGVGGMTSGLGAGSGLLGILGALGSLI
ncbi:unnamed protein product, partial [marine sediment metagenome]